MCSHRSPPLQKITVRWSARYQSTHRDENDDWIEENPERNQRIWGQNRENFERKKASPFSAISFFCVFLSFFIYYQNFKEFGCQILKRQSLPRLSTVSVPKRTFLRRFIFSVSVPLISNKLSKKDLVIHFLNLDYVFQTFEFYL